MRDRNLTETGFPSHRETRFAYLTYVSSRFHPVFTERGGPDERGKSGGLCEGGVLASQIALEKLIIVQSKIIKSALGLPQATHNVIVYAEANTFPQSTICEINTIKTIDRCAIFDNPTPI